MNPNEPNEPGEADQPIMIGADGKLVEVPDGWGPVDGATVKEFGIFISRSRVYSYDPAEFRLRCSHDTNGDGNCGRRSCPECGNGFQAPPMTPTRQQIQADFSRMGLAPAVDAAIERVRNRVRMYKAVAQAMARGYCTPANANKVLDPDLIMAMTDEVMQALPNLRLNEALDIVNASGTHRDDAEVIRHALGILRADSSLRASWHANLAMAMKDEGVDHDTAQRAATRFLDLLTKGAPTPPPRSMGALNSAIDCVNASGMKVAAEGMEIVPRQLIPDDQMDSWFVMHNDALHVTGPYADRDAAMAVWRTGTNVACVQGRIIQWLWSQRLEQIMRMSQVDAPAGHRI